MAVRQGTTHTIPIRYGGVIEDNAVIMIIMSQVGKQLSKSTKDSGEDVWYEPITDKDGAQIATRIYVSLSQEETLYFDPGKVNKQIRWIYAEGTAGASGIVTEEWQAILKKEVIRYE